MICPNCGYDNLPGSEECATCLQDLTHLDRPVPQDRYERRLTEDPVAILEPVPSLTVKASDTVRSVIQIMVDRNIGAVVVVDDKGAPVGIFSERDVLMRIVGHHENYLDSPVTKFMTRNPECLDVDAKIAFALHKMDGGDYRHMPVTRGGRLVGVISVRDLLRYVAGLCRENGGA
jgi:CBS domain-containing protein